MTSWQTRLRILANRIILGPLLTEFYDRLSPASSLGQQGERIAERVLLKRGMTVVQRSYAEAFGEIDLIAVDDRTVVFVEVKTRTSDYAGTPDEAVDLEKQRKISRLASSFVRRHGLQDSRCRFDVVAIELADKYGTPKIRYFQDAFEFVD